MVRSCSSDLKVENVLDIGKRKDGVRRYGVHWTSSWVSSHFLHNKTDQQHQQQQQPPRQLQQEQQQQQLHETLVEEIVFDPVSHQILEHTLGRVEQTANEEKQMDCFVKNDAKASSKAKQNSEQIRKCSIVDRERPLPPCIIIEDDSIEKESFEPQDMDIEEESNEGKIELSTELQQVARVGKLELEHQKQRMHSQNQCNGTQPQKQLHRQNFQWKGTQQQPIPLMEKLLNFNQKTQKWEQQEQHYGEQMHQQQHLQVPYFHSLPLQLVPNPYFPPPFAFYPAPML